MSANYIPLIGRLIEMIVNLLVKRKTVRDLILPLIQQAAIDGSLPDNNARRAFVLNYLVTEKNLSESEARLLIEAGLKLYKRIAEKDAQKAADAEEKRMKAEAKAAKKKAKES